MFQFYAIEQFSSSKKEHSLLATEQILLRLPENEKVYRSVAEVECENGDDVTIYPT